MLTTALTLALCAGTPLLTSSAAATPVQSDQPHWSYEDPDGPADWAGLSPTFGECSTGQNQSPIDLPDVVPDGGHDVGVATEQPGQSHRYRRRGVISIMDPSDETGARLISCDPSDRSRSTPQLCSAPASCR